MELFFVLVKRSVKIILLLLLTVAFLLGSLPPSAKAAPEPEIEPAPFYVPAAQVSLDVPANVMVGEDFTFTATFDNTSGIPGDAGYGPFIDILLPANGADGNGNQNPPLDGITFVSATYLGNPVTSTVLTFPGSGAANTCVDHPYAVALNTGAPLQVCGAPGDVLVVLQLPFGSFVSDQPPVTVEIAASLSDLADVGTALTIRARGGYQYGATALNDWCCGDATILSHPSTNSTTWPPASVTPSLFTVTKVSNAPEDETATGPNFVRQYTVTVDIADGQTLTNLDVTDTLPDNVQFVAFVGSSPASSEVSTPGTSAPGGTLTRRFASVTGGSGAADATMTFSFYIPLLDAGGDVLPPDTGAAANSLNQAQATANWTPIDPRDATLPPASVTGVCGTPCHALTDRSIATQKSVAIVTDASPTGYSSGDILEYTLDFQVSDFFAFDDVTLTDILSDGQRFDGTFIPRLQVDGNGYTLPAAGMDSANYTVDNSEIGNNLDPATDGTQRLVFRVSDELVTRGQSNGRLIGGCIDPATGSSSPDCATYDNDATTGTITFRAQIQQNFTDDYPSGDASVDHGDVLDDALTITGEVLDRTDPLFPATGSTASDGSAADATIAFGALSKSVYAVNGVACGGCAAEINAGLNPGDAVTFRLRYTQPASNFEETVITDYLPLPVFNAAEVLPANFDYDPACSAGAGAPAAGHACLGPADTFHSLTSPVPAVPTLSTNAAANTVSFTYTDYDSTVDIFSEIDLLFTVTVRNDPFADGLFLTNQAHVAEGTTNALPTVQDDILQIKLSEPVMSSQKGVIWTSSPTGVFSPASSGPVTFSGPASSPRWTGTINSNGLSSSPINSDLSGVDAGDIVTFAITLENTGSSLRGAFDLILRDTFPAIYSVPTTPTGLNLQVYYGNGTGPISWGGLGGGPDGAANTADDLFGNGIQLVDPSAGQGVCQAHDPNLGNNVIVITYDLQIRSGVAPGTYTNTEVLTNYAGSDGGPSFITPGGGTFPDNYPAEAWDVPIKDDADVTINAAPNKYLVATSEAHTTGSNVAIGEIVRYRLVVRIPEGNSSNVQFQDLLPGGMIFLNDDTARVAFVSNTGITSTDTGTLPVPAIPAACNLTGTTADATTPPSSSITCALADANIGSSDSTDANEDSYSGGVDPYFKLGDLVNNDDDDDAEYVIVEFNALVHNSTTNQNDNGEVLGNRVRAFTGGVQSGSDSESVDLTVRETFLTLNKANSVIGAADAGDVVTYTITIRNPSATSYATAFDVHFTDALDAAYLTLVPGSVTVTAPSTYSIDSTVPNTIDVTTTSLPLDGLVTITYQATIGMGVNPGQAVNNTGAITWTSLPGTNGTTGNTTGSNTPGAGGDDNGERNGNGGVNNDYRRTSATSFTATAPAISKQLTATSASHTTGSNVAIGEVVSYNILLTFPEGTTPSDTVVDDLPTGLEVTGTPEIITTAAASGGALAANFNGTMDAPTITVTGTNDIVTFGFANVSLPGDNNVANNTVLLRFNARVSDIAANVTGMILSNSATNRVGTGTPTTSNVVPVTIVQPSITFGKTIESLPTPLDAGGVVHYRIRYANGTGANVSTAMDVNITDALAAALLLPSTGAPDVVITASAGVGAITNNSTTSAIDITVASVPPGESVTVDFYPVIQNTVTPGQVIDNIGNTNWTSLEGVVAGERTGVNGPTGSPDNYAAVSNASLTIPASHTITKQLTATSAIHTTGSQVAIGEVVTYSILLTFPEGTTPSDVVVDTLPAGLEVVPGSTSYVTSAAASGGLLTENFSATPGYGLVHTTDTVANSATFTFTNVVLPGDNNVDNNTILLRFQARVANVAANVTGRTLSNEATNQVGTGTPVTSNAVTATVVQPSITFTKEIVSLPTPLDAGGVVHYRIRYANGTGADVSTAMDVHITDALAAELRLLPTTATPVPVVITHSAGVLDSEITDNSTTSAIDITVASVPAGESVTVDFYPVIQSSITPGQVIDNIGNTTWTSLEGVVVGERTGVNGPTGSPNNYAAVSNASLTIPSSVSIIKQLASTSASHTTGSNVAIGEVVTYDILLTLPEGATPSDTVVDDLPTGLEVTGTPEVITAAAASGGLLAADFNGTMDAPTITVTGTNDIVTFGFANISLPGDNNITNNTILLRFEALVLNVDENDRGDTVSNVATNQMGTAAPTTSNPVNVTVVEPVLNLTKQVTDPNPAVGEVLTFTILLSHDATSTADAFDVVLIDDLPVELTLDLSSVSVATGGTGAITNLRTNHSGNHIEVTADSLERGATIGVTYEATVTGPYASSFHNDAIATWTSLSGADTGERTGTNTPAYNNYRSTDQVVIGVNRALAKNLITSNVSSTSPDNIVTIGEILTYQVVLTIPAGSTDLAIITDTLDSGLAFVDCATSVPAGAGNMHDIVAGPDITSTNFTFAADAHGHNVASCNHGTAATNNPQISNSGSTIRWDLGDVTNTGAAPETIALTYRVIVLDIGANVQNTTLDNDVDWVWSGGTLSTRAAPSLRITEPELQVEKTVDPEVAALGTTITYSIEISHTANSLTTAYDVVLTDGIPTGLALDQTSVAVTGSVGLPAAVITTSSTQLTVYWSEFPLGATARVEFQARFVGPSPVVNSAGVEWSSLQIDPVPHFQPQSAYNALSTERQFNPLDRTINDYVVSSSVSLSVPRLPKTGFAPGRVTGLPEQPADASYSLLGDMWLEIPRLGVKVNIVGVPYKSDDWNLTWLGSQAGYLDGTAYPTHNGNTGITAHAYLADGSPGPFVDLSKLSYGDQIIIHMSGQRYIYEVRENKLIRPNEVSVLKHEEYPWLTLITCKTYNESTGDYRYRVSVRAVLVKVEDE